MPQRKRPQRALRYAVDASNRLIVIDPEDPLHPKRVLEGRFGIEGKNRLVYAFSEAGPDGSRQATFDGNWRLSSDDQLEFAVRASEGARRQTLYLKGALLQAEANGLIFALNQAAGEASATQRLTLSGRWAADSKNRLSFLVEKGQGGEDKLTLQGGWEVGPHHELLYRYRQSAGNKRFPQERALIFEGSWDISRQDRLVYRLLGSDTSAFEFRVSLQTPSLRAAEGRLVYQAGIGLSGGRSQKQRIVLFGSWKINRDLSVSFEIPYSEGRLGSIEFEAQAALSRRDTVTVSLANSRNQRLGLSVTFTRQLTPDASLFLRLQQSAEENSVIGGVQVRF